MTTRCDWCLGEDIYLEYHDSEWGVPLFDDQKLFEFLLLEGAQAGLSWITILKKRDNYRAAMENFNPHKIANYGDAQVEKLLNNSGIVRNRLKINSVIRNARCFVDLTEGGESFSDFLWSFSDGKARQNTFAAMSEVPASTIDSDRMSVALKKKGFNFVGSTICYAFMQATGMVNDHLVTCFRHRQCRDLAC